ncbi:MAG: hypothetical protein IJA69_01430, partial [Clostridia bacterium]|nr:hypothetical protein [Clostridia bacterium]
MKKIKIFMITLLIAISSFAMVACGEKYDDFSLSFSTKQIEMSVDDKDVSYRLKIENYVEMKPTFDFYFSDNIAEISEVNDLGKGIYELVMNPLKGGTTTLTITLLEGNKSLSIPVKVVEKVKSISLKQNVFALRGGQIILSQDLFKFQPEETLQRNLEFYYNSEVIENGVLNIEEEMPDVLQITAKSLDNDEVSLTFDLAILDKIDTTNITLYTKEGGSLVEVAAFVQDVEENDFIEIIVNDQNLHKKNLELHFDVADNYIYTLESENDATFIEKQTSVVDGISLFEIQQGKQTSLSEDFLKLNISHKGYEAYVETLKFKVKIKTRPSLLKLNGQADFLMVNLFNSDSEENGGSALVSISPTKAEFDYAYLEFYFATEVENELVLTKKTYEEISNYLVITQNDLAIQDNPDGDLKIELANPLEYYGINCTPNDEMIYIKVICESDYAERGTVYNYIKVKVNKAATVFEVDEKYENATIYVEKGENITFTGFKVLDEGAYIGNVYAYPRYGSMGYVNVSQTPNTENIVSIDIEALKVGNATYDIMLSSGISTTLNIVVKEKLSIEDFKIYIANTENSDIGEIEYRANETTGVSSLHKISIRGDKEKNKKFVVTPLINPIDADLYTLEISTASPFLTINETELTTLGYTQGEDAVVDVALKLKTIEDFKLVESEEVISYNFYVEIFESIKSFTMTAMNMGDNQGESNYVAVYNETSVGYTDSAMSKVKITTQINPETSKYRKIEWNFSVQSTLETDGFETYYQLRYGNDIGKFYPSTQTFVCDGTNVDAIIGLTFTIIGKVAECGLEYTRSIQIVVREYVAVDRVWLYNHASHIYLDSIHSEQILYPYVLPTDANNKNLSVWFEPDAGTSSSIVQINYSATEIKINYSGVGSGTGVLHIIPTACFEDSLGNTRYSLDIRVTVARGETEDTPLIISSFEEFLAINTPEGLKKHYLINTVLDANGYNFTTMGEFSGTITGYNIYDTDATFGTNSGSIINLNLTKTDSDGTLALFSSIAPNAKITNLTIFGKFSPEQDNVSSAAMIAGVNNGLIKNVNVIIEKSSIKTSVQNFNFGGIAAINNGVVACDIIDYNNVPADYDDYYYTTNSGQLEKTTNNYLPLTTLMVEMLEGGVKIEATEVETVYVGGLVGQNQGTLIFDWINTFTRYNMYGINTCSYFDVNSTASTMGVDGAAGYNNNIIKNIVAVGEVKANKYVGGLVGHMADGVVENCETRTYVRAKDYVAGLVGIISKGKLSNNKVVAVDDNIRTGFDASLIYITEISTNEITYNEICNQGDGQILLDNNTAVSYINRDVVDYVEGETDVMFNLNKYYGDIFYQKEPTAKKQFTKAAQIDFLSKIQNTVSLMYYYNAKERQHQQYVSAYNIQNLPDDILGVVDIDVTIESYSPLIVVESNGSLRLLGTGYARLRLYNTLNAKDYKDIYIHILNAVTGFEVFA